LNLRIAHGCFKNSSNTKTNTPKQSAVILHNTAQHPQKPFSKQAIADYTTTIRRLSAR